MKPDDQHIKSIEEVERIAYLIAGYLRNSLSNQEHDELDEWITASERNQLFFEELTDPAVIRDELRRMGEPDTGAILQRLKGGIKFNSPAKKKTGVNFINYAVAASILLLVGLFYFFNRMEYFKQHLEKPLTNQSILPGGNYAMLTLADGRSINLAVAENGLLDSSSGSDVLKTADGQLSYENPDGRMVAYHILQTSVGGQYSVLLPDGTRVWLNSSSSLKYPVAFTGKERVVELKGEGYFEVTKSIDSKKPEIKKPFIVKVGEHAAIEVLGTRFNVNAYGDEPYIATTLLEGRVKAGDLQGGGLQKELSPGQQAHTGLMGETEVVSGVNTELAVAWKNGEFKFKNATINEIMRQVSRWYGAEIVYEDKVDYHFTATIYRNEPVEKLLGILEATKGVKFRLEGRKIFINR
ncbi:MAG: DUF4974 domain-containing protein [Sphingobacteriales bacterium]|nr:DUF4974 domain-containing protein [Sphingobacteriales bacterium]